MQLKSYNCMKCDFAPLVEAQSGTINQ